MFTQKKIKIYSDKKYLTQDEYEPIFFPFWGLSPKEKNTPLGGQYDNYLKNGVNYFEMTNISNCDFVVLPEKYNPNNLLKTNELVHLAEQYNKPIIIFFADDSEEKIPIKNSYIFRTSLYKRDLDVNEFAMPFWSEDFAMKYNDGKITLRKKTIKPIVSYCGYTKVWKDWIKDLIGKKYGSWKKIRHQAVRILGNNKLIKTNFIIRDDFFGGAYEKRRKLKEEFLISERQILRKEYAENMKSGDYCLVTRGKGNFSIRFYELFSLGKIPLFIDTDCAFPYPDYIDWKNVGVWLEDKELDKIDNILIEFHKKISEERFIELQKETRFIWEEWLSPDGFFKNFYRHFEKK